jgi:hypothetical protein
VASKKAVRDDEVPRKDIRRILNNLVFNVFVVSLVSYTSRSMERWVGTFHGSLSTERFAATFLANVWFIGMWFSAARLAKSIYGALTSE